MRPRDRAALLLVTLALTFSCLAIGGAPRWAAWIGAGLCLSTAFPYVTSRRTASRPSVFLLPIVAMTAMTALQLIPLPAAIAEILSPSKVALLRDNARAWGESEPSWAVSSFDPPATLVELAKLTGYLALAWTCGRLASERAARRWLLAIPVVAAALVASITLAHVLLRVRKVYGIYQTSTNLDFVGPIVSPNHLASLLALAVPLAASLSLQAKGLRRVAWFAVAALLVATTLLSGSRGGVIGLLAGLTVIGAILFVRHRAGPDDTHPVVPAVTAPVGLAAGGAIALLVFMTAGDVTRDLSRTSFQELHEPDSKFQVWKRAAHMTGDHRWLGVGKGAFEPAFTPYAETGTVVYSHVENSYLQTVVDWGVPGAALILLALGTAALSGLRRWRQGALEAGALGGLAAVAIHDLADFSIDLPAVALALIVASSVLFPERLAATRRNGNGVPRSALAARIVLLMIGLLVVGLAASPLGRTAAEDLGRVTSARESDRLAVARTALDRHPASFMIAGRAAEALFLQRDARALKLIARSLSMNSNHSGLRHIAARMLVVSNRPEQAAVEFAAAARLSRDVRPIVADVLAAFPDPEDVADSLPTGKDHAAAIVRALVDNKPAALAFAQRVATMHPRDPDMQALLAAAALDARDGEVARRAAQAAWAIAPTARHGVLLGEALKMLGQHVSAAQFLEDAIERTATEPSAERVRVLLVLAETQLVAGDPTRAKSSLERARDLGGLERNWLVLVHTRLADVEERLGNRNQAAWERQRAMELESTP